MKRLLLLLTTMLLSFAVSAACSSDSDANNDKSDQNEEVNTESSQTPDDQNTEAEEGEDTTDNNNDSSDDNSDQKEADTSAGDFKDQKDLKIGDTAQVETTLGKYEITIDSVKKEDEIDGESSPLDYLFVVDLTIKNIGDAPIDANESKDILEITQMLEGSGFTDISSYFDSIEEMEGTLQPGDDISGQMVFQEEEADTFYIRASEGSVASGAVKNQVIWTFTLDEIDK